MIFTSERTDGDHGYAEIAERMMQLAAEWILYANSVLLGLSGLIFSPSRRAANPQVVAQEDRVDVDVLESVASGVPIQASRLEKICNDAYISSLRNSALLDCETQQAPIAYNRSMHNFDHNMAYKR